LNTPEFEPIEVEVTPLFSELNSKIYQNKKLFDRIETIYNSKDKSKLTPEQQRLVWYHYANFVREGAKASAESKAKIAKINQELASLFTKFSQNQLADESNYYLELKTEADFEGLPTELKNAAIAEAKERNLEVMGCVANTRSSIEPFLTFSSRRDLREKAFDIFVKRGDNSNENNNNAILVKILKLRAEKAKLLGFKTFADWSLSNTMAQNPLKAMELMQPKHFIMPFLAHALGNFSGALLCSALAASFRFYMVMLIASLFFVGGIYMVMLLPSPLWFNLTDLILAYFPMAYLGYFLLKKK
jgi:peptidyl-dipeptidase Dcp